MSGELCTGVYISKQNSAAEEQTEEELFWARFLKIFLKVGINPISACLTYEQTLQDFKHTLFCIFYSYDPEKKFSEQFLCPTQTELKIFSKNSLEFTIDESKPEHQDDMIDIITHSLNQVACDVDDNKRSFFEFVNTCFNDLATWYNGIFKTDQLDLPNRHTTKLLMPLQFFIAGRISKVTLKNPPTGQIMSSADLLKEIDEKLKKRKRFTQMTRNDFSALESCVEKFKTLVNVEELHSCQKYFDNNIEAGRSTTMRFWETLDLKSLTNIYGQDAKLYFAVESKRNTGD